MSVHNIMLSVVILHCF